MKKLLPLPKPTRLLAFIFVFVFTSHYPLATNHSLFAAPVELDYMEYTTTAAAQAAYVSNSSVTATGGTITEVGGYRIHTFTSNGTFTMNVSTNVEVLVVAGGGGGAARHGGGGGGGGLIYNNNYAVSAGNIAVSVGGGGTAGVGPSSNTTATIHGGKGGGSSFGTIVAEGGGGGIGYELAGSPTGNGGSGGGGRGAQTPVTGGTGTGGQGQNGGSGYSAACYTGGGGGAGNSGGTATASTSGNGGAGATYSISGSAVIYAGGGGGGGDTAGSGGSGGGGNGASGTGNGTPGSSGLGGGGGGCRTNPSGDAGAGGSGIVIVRYFPSPVLQCFSENSITTQGSYSLKASAASGISINQILTRTVSPTIDLTDREKIKFDIRSTRTGSNIKIGIRDSGGTTTYITPNITAANEYQTIQWDISSVANSDKDAIDRIIIQIVNADAANTFYIDNLFAGSIAPAAAALNRASALSSNSIEWGWQDNSSSGSQEDGFKVYSSTGGLLTTRTADTTFWIETGLKRNKEYSRYVRAYNDAGEADSSTATWRTKPGNYQEKTIVRTGANAYGCVGDGVIEHNIPVKSGQLATVKVWVRYNTEYGAAEKPTVTLSNLGVSSSQQMSVGSNTWEELTLSGTPSRNGSLLLKIEGLSSAPGARVYADDITVSQ